MSKLNQDPAMIEIMEADLKTKIQAAIDANPDLAMVVHGVFSIDDLETKMESDLGRSIAVGVQYAGCSATTKAVASSNPAQGNSIKTVMFNFTVILGTPTSDFCDDRNNATKLLSVLRMAIFGKSIGADRVQRTWEFVMERPEVGASSKTMLYHAQVWQVAMQNLGTAA